MNPCSQMKHNIHSHCSLMKIKSRFVFLILFSSFAVVASHLQCPPLLHLHFILHLCWSFFQLFGRNHWNTQKPHLNAAASAMFAPVVSHILSRSLTKHTPTKHAICYECTHNLILCIWDFSTSGPGLTQFTHYICVHPRVPTSLPVLYFNPLICS